MDLENGMKSAHTAMALPHHSHSPAEGEGQLVRIKEAPGFSGIQ